MKLKITQLTPRLIELGIEKDNEIKYTDIAIGWENEEHEANFYD